MTRCEAWAKGYGWLRATGYGSRSAPATLGVILWGGRVVATCGGVIMTKVFCAGALEFGGEVDVSTLMV